MTTTCDLGPDSRSQVAPFAVEKAVHNIMFIKHHMKRQDEFDAVSFGAFFKSEAPQNVFHRFIKKQNENKNFV